MATAAIIILFVVLLLIGVPLFASIGITTALFLVKDGYPGTMAVQQFFSMADRTSLTAIPLFVLISTLMSGGLGARRLVAFVRALTGWLPGGLALTTIAACLIFASLAGLSPAAIIAVGAMMYPGLVGGGYNEKFSLGFVTSAGSLGILVPPSIVVIVFGVVAEVNIEALFIAGIAPVLIISIFFIGYALINGRGGKTGRDRFQPEMLWKTFKEGFWAILLPVAVGGGIYTGLFTVTQAAAVGAIYAFAVEIFFYRALKLRDLPRLLRESGATVGMLLVIIAMTFSLNWYLTAEGIPETLTDWIVARFRSPLVFLPVVNLLLLLLGCMMDILSAIFITVPLLLPAAVAMGIDPVHFGIIFIVNFEIGYLTPPVGINLFTSGAVFRKPASEVARASLPFMLLLLVALILITYFPSITLWLVRLTGNG